MQSGREAGAGNLLFSIFCVFLFLPLALQEGLQEGRNKEGKIDVGLIRFKWLTGLELRDPVSRMRWPAIACPLSPVPCPLVVCDVIFCVGSYLYPPLFFPFPFPVSLFFFFFFFDVLTGLATLEQAQHYCRFQTLCLWWIVRN